MPGTLLATKLHIPRVRRVLVHRPRLIERLDAGLYRKLTLVSAPAGYGKTTVMCDWIHTSAERNTPLRAAWLSLDQADNELARFLTYVIAALQRIDASIGVEVQAALAESQAPSVETLLARLVRDIAAAAGDPLGGSGRAFALVLDDYHLITAQPVHTALNFLLEHLPDTMHLLVSGRADPPLPISRLRVQGEITEIRTPDLRFTKEEAAAFLNDHMSLDLSPRHITALETRTEGWIASLQLAALSLQGHADKQAFVAAFSGSHRYVIDYLVDEVLSRQPKNVRAFLHHTSILERFCAPLCSAVCFPSGKTPNGSDGTAASRRVLGQLERDNLFLVPLDDERRWYRFHYLFAHFLRRRLREKEPELIFELLRRASHWFEAEGMKDEAIQHALMAGDSERATRLVDQIAASLVVRRDPKRLLNLVDQLPRNLCQEYPMLCIWHAWALLFAGQLDDVEPVLQIAAANAAKAPQFPISGYATTVRAYVANQFGDLTKALDLTQQALEQMSDAAPEKTTLIFQGAAVIWMGVNYRYLGDLDRARQFFVEAASLNRKAGSIYGALSAFEQQGDLAMVQGRLHRAAEISRRGLRVAQEWSDQEQRGRGTLLAASGLHLVLGTVLYQWNDLAGAVPHIQRAVELDELGQARGRMNSYRMLAYLKQAAGDYQAAYDLLCQACALRENIGALQINVAAEPSLEQLRILLSGAGPETSHLLGDAARRLETVGLDSDVTQSTGLLDFSSPAYYARESEYTDLVRVLIATGRAEKAIPVIERLLEAAQSMGRQGDAIRFLVLQALAFQTLDDTTTALDSLAQALTLAEPEGYVRVFVDEGEPMAELLQELALRAAASDYVEKLLAAFNDATKDQRPKTEADRSSFVLHPSSSLVEPLSDRELEVLRLLATGLKYRQVAEELVISLNTVRTHTKNIYGKLGVRSRTQAIARARELELL